MAKVDAQPYEFELEPASAALVIIDMQRDFVDPGGFGEALGNDVSLLRKAIAPTRRALDGARRHEMLVIHTREGHRPDLSDLPPSKKLRGRLKNGIGDPGPMGRILVRGEYGHDIIDALRPIPGEIVLDKASYGAFCGTNCERILRGRGVETLFFAGVTADVCVHTTLREACDRWFSCNYVKDAISCPDPGIRSACEKMIEEEGGIWGSLTTVEETIGLWRP